MPFVLVVNGKVLDPRLSREECFIQRLLHLKLEMGATKKVWLCEVKLGEVREVMS